MSDLKIDVEHPVPLAERNIPTPRRRFNTRKKWQARFAVLVMVAVAVTAGGYLARAKLARSVAAAATLDIGTVTLTAVPVPVDAVKAGRVTDVAVHAQQRVSVGTKLGTVLVTSTTPSGKTTVTTTAVRAPTAGIVADDPVAAGNSLVAGQTFAVLYNPADLILVANVSLSDLIKLHRGMTATLRTTGFSRPIKAVVQRAVPRIGGNQAGVASDQLQLVLTPAKTADVAALIPGLQFTGAVNIKSGANGTGASLLKTK